MPASRWSARALTVVLGGALAFGGVVAAEPAEAATTGVSSRYLLNHLGADREHPAGYDRDEFSLWSDADHDGCDTRYEVLIAEAVVKPRVRAGCQLVGGRWRSPYDGITTTNPSGFDIDHLVPLNEAWQSGAWRWSAATRTAYANDLGFSPSLVAVTAHANRSKGDREPLDWMPDRARFACTYVTRWVAVKWRWHLTINTGERAYLTSKLRSCGWPSLTKPSRPTIITGTTSGATTTATRPLDAPIL